MPKCVTSKQTNKEAVTSVVLMNHKAAISFLQQIKQQPLASHNQSKSATTAQISHVAESQADQKSNSEQSNSFGIWLQILDPSEVCMMYNARHYTGLLVCFGFNEGCYQCHISVKASLLQPQNRPLSLRSHKKKQKTASPILVIYQFLFKINPCSNSI